MGKGKTVSAAVSDLVDKQKEPSKKEVKKKTDTPQKDLKSFKDVLKNAVSGKKAHDHASVDFDKHGIEKIHMTEYSGSAYDPINTHLRSGGKVSAYEKKVMASLDKAFNHAETKEDLVVYRGFSSNIASKLQDGDIFEDPGYTSTTSEANNANTFARGTDAVIFKIHIPKGSKAMSMKSQSQFPGEEEILLNKGSKFRIVGRDKKTRTRKETIHVELVND